MTRFASSPEAAARGAASAATASSEIVATFPVSPTVVRPLWSCRLKPSIGLSRSLSACKTRPSGVASERASRLMSIPWALRRWLRSAPSGLSMGTKSSV